ncbi:MAG: PAS domain-containing protein [Proteobacteria bacterium]|nr:PAS domain-containing protein [Pseudomonadota bacterium]
MLSRYDRPVLETAAARDAAGERPRLAPGTADTTDAAGSRRAQSPSQADARPGARAFPLRAYLIAMTLAVVLPMGLLGALAIREVAMEFQHAYKARLRATAKLLGNALDAEIQMRKAAIMALADSPLIDGDPGPDLYNYARQIGAGLGAWVSIRTPDRWTMNTRLPYGEPLRSHTGTWDPERDSKFHVTNILHAPDLPSPFVAVIGPVFRDGKLTARIGIPFNDQRLGKRLAEGVFNGAGVSCLLDGNGAVIARTRRHEEFVGTTAPEWLRALIASPDQRIGTGHLLDGGDVIVATAHPREAPTWTVVVAQPVSEYYREWFRPLMLFAGGGLLVILASLAFVYWFASWLVRPLSALTAGAKLVAQGRDRPPEVNESSRVAEFEALRTSLNEAAEVMDGRARAVNVAFASARRERNLLHSVVNGTSDPTFVRDALGRLVLVNEAGLALLGLPATGVIGQVRPEPGAPADALSRAEDVQVFNTGLPIAIERTVTVDGERRTFVGTKSPWRSPSGDVLGVVVIIHDITEWKRSEDRLRNLQAELIRTGRLSAMGALASGLAHELNQPLAAITNFLGAARRLIGRAASGGLAAAEAAKALDVASGAMEDAAAQALRAGAIVNRLREFIGRGPSSMRLENIGELASDACALAMPQDVRGRVALTVEVAPGTEPVFVDRVQIQQVLVNLVLNAVQSMRDVPRPELRISAARSYCGDIVLTVTDNGPGIPEHMLAAIFEPFVSTRDDGLGMGLAIARIIASAHGARLSAANNPGGGATFTLTLPAVLTMEAMDA